MEMFLNTLKEEASSFSAKFLQCVQTCFWIPDGNFPEHFQRGSRTAGFCQASYAQTQPCTSLSTALRYCVCACVNHSPSTLRPWTPSVTYGTNGRFVFVPDRRVGDAGPKEDHWLVEHCRTGWNTFMECESHLAEEYMTHNLQLLD